jgi:hypothetical protein
MSQSGTTPQILKWLQLICKFANRPTGKELLEARKKFDANTHITAKKGVTKCPIPTDELQAPA